MYKTFSIFWWGTRVSHQRWGPIEASWCTSADPQTRVLCSDSKLRHLSGPLVLFFCVHRMPLLAVLKAWLQETRNKLTSILEYIMRAIKVHVVRIYYSFGDGECLYSWGKLALIISLFPMLLVWNQIGEQMHIINLEMVDKDNIHVKLYTLGLGNYAYNTWYFSVSMEISIKNQLCLEYVVWIRCLHNDFCSCSLIVTSNLSGMSR